MNLSISAILLVTALSSASGAISVSGTLDTFSATTGDWAEGGRSPNKPTVVPTDGPGGASDGHLLNISSGNSGAGGRWVMINASSAWTGDWIGAGVTGVGLDVKNDSALPLNLRISMNGPGGLYVSTNGVVVAANSGWQPVVIPFSQSGMTSVGGSSFLDTAQSVAEIRLVSATNPTHVGDQAALTVRMDNIRPLGPIPEPSGLALALAGLAAIARRKR